MRAPTSSCETELRSKFDFANATRGKYYERYKKGHSVTLLDEDSDDDDPLSANGGDSQLLEIAGKHLLISRLVAAGFEVAEPIRDRGNELIVYRDGGDFAALPIQLKASSEQSFSLDAKYDKFPRLLITYIWNVQTSEENDIYVLTFEEALQVLRRKGYDKTDSWKKNHRYFVRNAGIELKEMLEPYKATPKLWRSKLLAS